MSTERPSWVPSTISEQSAPAFVEATMKARKDSQTTFVFEGKKYAVSKKLAEATFKDGYRYIFSGQVYFNFQYNDSAYDNADWLTFVRDNVNSDIPDECSVIKFDHSAVQNDLSDAFVKALSEHEFLDRKDGTIVVAHASFNDSSEIRDIVTKINEELKLKCKVSDGDESDLAELVSEEYFGGGTIDLKNAVNTMRPEDIDSFDSSDYDKHFEMLKNNFNSTGMGQHFDKALSVTSVKMLAIESSGSAAVYTLVVETSKKLTSDEIKKLKSAIDGQMSDGWGEGAEQREVTTAPEVGNGFIDVTVSFWKSGKVGAKLIATETIESDIKASAKKYIDKAKKIFKNAKAAVKKLSENTQDGNIDTSEFNLLISKLRGFGTLKEGELRKLLVGLRHHREKPGYIANNPTLRAHAVTLLADILDELASDRISLQRVAKNAPKYSKAEIAAYLAMDYSKRDDSVGSEDDLVDAVIDAAIKEKVKQSDLDAAWRAAYSAKFSVEDLVKSDPEFSKKIQKAIADYVKTVV